MRMKNIECSMEWVGIGTIEVEAPLFLEKLMGRKLLTSLSRVCKRLKNEEGEKGMSAHVINKFNVFLDASLKRHLNLKIRVNLEIRLRINPKAHTDIYLWKYGTFFTFHQELKMKFSSNFEWNWSKRIMDQTFYCWTIDLHCISYSRGKEWWNGFVLFDIEVVGVKQMIF